MRKKSYRSKHIRCVTFHVSVCDACAYPIAVRLVSDEILIAFGANFDADAQQSYLKIETRHLASGRQGRAASAFSLFIYYIRSKRRRSVDTVGAMSAWKMIIDAHNTHCKRTHGMIALSVSSRTDSKRIRIANGYASQTDTWNATLRHILL